MLIVFFKTIFLLTTHGLTRDKKDTVTVLKEVRMDSDVLFMLRATKEPLYYVPGVSGDWLPILSRAHLSIGPVYLVICREWSERGR